MPESMEAETFKLIAGLITGSGGAVVVAVLWVRQLSRQNEQVIELLNTKDKELVDITRESIACIEASLNHREIEASFRTRLEGLLGRIERTLEQRTTTA